MTAAIEYSYLNDGFSLSINEGLMNRAVRVKGLVKDKLKRVFDRNVVEVGQPQVNKEVALSVTADEKETLVDLSEEKLRSLNDSLNALESQKVPYVVSRAVLFTKPLVSKIEGVTKKWFKDMPVVEQESKLPVGEIPNAPVTSQSIGVVPGTWDDIPEKVEATVVPEPQIDTPKVDIGAPVIEPTPAVEQEEVPEVTVHTQEEKPSDMEIPSFMPNMDELIPSDITPVNESVSEDAPQSFEFVPEPKQVGTDEMENDFVPEPTVLAEENEAPTVEIPTEETSTEEVATDEVSTNEVPEPVSIPTDETRIDEPEETHEATDTVSEEVDKPSRGNMSIEEKIAEIIQRKRAVHSEGTHEVTTVSEEEPNEEVDKVVRDGLQPEFTQAGVVARLQRINNALKDKDATIRGLTAKYEGAKDEVAQVRAKISGYEEVVNDLTARNRTLTKDNERLSARVEEAENASKSKITKLETQVNELTEASALVSENHKKAIADLEEKHAAEIARLKESHARELKTVSDTKDKQIQAIYMTISEALGETTAEEDYSHQKAA